MPSGCWLYICLGLPFVLALLAETRGLPGRLRCRAPRPLSLTAGAYGELLACHTKGVRELAHGAYSFLAASLVLHLFDPRFARFLFFWSKYVAGTASKPKLLSYYALYLYCSLALFLAECP